MLDKIMLNLKTKFSANTTVYSDTVTPITSSTYEPDERTFFDYLRINNILNVSYSPLFSRESAKPKPSDDPIETRMFPRVFGNTTPNAEPWSPVALAAKQRPLEELDNVVEKFIRVVAINDVRMSATASLRLKARQFSIYV
jgi:hypothetical protein